MKLFLKQDPVDRKRLYDYELTPRGKFVRFYNMWPFIFVGVVSFILILIYQKPINTLDSIFFTIFPFLYVMKTISIYHKWKK